MQEMVEEWCFDRARYTCDVYVAPAKPLGGLDSARIINLPWKSHHVRMTYLLINLVVG